MNRPQHGALLDLEHCRGYQAGCRARPARVFDEAFSAKEITGTHHPEHCLLALLRDDSKANRTRLDKIDSVRLLPLMKEFRALLKI